MIESFIDELVNQQPCRGALVKTAKAGFYGRMGAIGAGAGATSHLLSKLKHELTGAPPWEAPRGSTVGAATKTGIGGLTLAAALAAIPRILSKGKK
jgi:hypothetical protein